MKKEFEEFGLMMNAKVPMKCLICHKDLNHEENEIWIAKNGVYHMSCYIGKFPEEYEKELKKMIKDETDDEL